MTEVGNFPTGGRLSPDGRFYWSVSAGHGYNDVRVVELATGNVVQVLPLPGSYGQMSFTADGRRAYVSGTPKGSTTYPSTQVKGEGGDVVHVFDVGPTGHATEMNPFALPATTGGSGRTNSFPADPNLKNGPAGLAVTPDGKTLVVALYNADAVAVINTANGSATTVAVGKYPFGVGFDRGGKNVYITNAYDGTLSKFDATVASPTVTTISGLGDGTGGVAANPNQNSQPQYVLADPTRDLIYVAVTNHDGVAVVDTKTNSVTKFISLKRPEGYGSQPVALALAADAKTLYAANAGENSIAAIALEDRSDGSAKKYDVVGKIPTADYTTDVQVTPDGCTLIWQAGRGFNAGPNPQYASSHGHPAVNNDTSDPPSPYPSYVSDMLIGRVGVLPTPNDAGFALLKPVVDATVQPENAQAPPAGTPLHGAPVAGGFAPSSQIKFVFYVVKENRTYDQIFGSDPRGDGDPALQVLEDNCGAANTAFLGNNRSHFGCGTTPNQHALSRKFVLLDRFYEDSEVSFDGHVITAGAYATNYSLKSVHQDYSNRKRPSNEIGVYPVTFPPKYFLFDQAVTQGISFRNYGELSGGAAPGSSDDGRTTYSQVQQNSDTANYPSNIFNGCFQSNTGAPDAPQCAFDCGMGCNAPASGTPPKSISRIDAFNKTFTQQVATCTAMTINTPACTVPHFNYMIMMSDHTNGVGSGARDPLSMIADNDLGVGQLVDILSHSAIWPYTAVFVVEDDSQDGADHVDAHRAPAFVMGPYVKHGGAAIHTRYDQYSVVRSIELILGLQPLSVFDASATPMYDAFMVTPDNSPYTAIKPEKNLMAVCPCAPQGTSSAKASAQASYNAALSDALPFSQVDRVPQSIIDRILWQRVFGENSTPPAPGPGASRVEAQRAVSTVKVFEQYRDNPALAKEKLSELLTGRDDD